ncbi:MAG: M28 family metallopeptidase, partial [Gemmatimonadota bacterium]|nr:M28 family metallopeptidase [Gemmatimonadota bacterium]
GAGGPESISEADIAEHLAVLASDEFGGRAPSSPGEELTVTYLTDQFRALGLEPGAAGSYTQDVPLVDITADPTNAPLVVNGGGTPLSFSYGDDFVTWTNRVVEASGVEDSDLVFVGYGIVAPEVGWNDYEGVDVEGKTVVILVNDPGYATQDPDVFSGNSMTYYGRWTYKYEEAARQGAAAALIVHQTAPAAYGWETVRNSWTGPQFKLQSEDGNAGAVAISGWMTEAMSRSIFDRAGLDFDELYAEAASGNLRPREMGLTLTTSVSNDLRFSDSKNVIAVLPGAEAPDEYFIYMAHWDHFGTDAELVAAGEDGIYNGALDNASGTAALLELAQAYANRREPPRRSVVFLAVTAEEQGLLGSAHYAANPVVPLERTVAGLNMDGLSNFGPTKDLVVIGYGMSELDAIADRAAAAQDRRIVPDPEPEKGYYFRSDHFELAKKGVPMIYPEHGIDHVELGETYGRERNGLYTAERYHMVTDEFDETWDLTGAVPDVRLYYEVGRAVIDSDVWPSWNDGTEFKAARDASVR